MRLPQSVSRHAPCLVPWLLAPLLASCAAGVVGQDWNPLPLWVPTDVVVADIDGDGRADVVTLAMYQTDVSHREGRLSVYRQTSPGVFAAPEVYTVGVYPWRLRVADVDGDGAPDLVIADADGHQLLWMRQDPAQRGRFQSPAVVATGMSVADVAVGDLNHDGAMDLVIAECTAGLNRALVLYQDPGARGTFGPPLALATPGSSCAVAVADIDGDGRDDLAGWFVTRSLTATGDTVTPGRGMLGIAWQAGDGTMGLVTALATRDGVNAERVVAVDYLGNGASTPLVYLTPQTDGYQNEVLVALHDPGSREFTRLTGIRLSGIQGTDDAAFADLDGDGHVDAVIAGLHRANRLRQLGDGSLQIVGTDELPIDGSRVAIGDIDADGRPDIVLYGGEDQVVRMLQSQLTPGQFGAPAPLR